MRVWTITVGEPIPGFSGTSRPWRCGALSQLLADRGHEVTWWTSSVDHFTKTHMVDSSAEHVVSDGLKVQFLHGPVYRRNVSFARQRNHWTISREFRRLAPQQPRPDIILCSFPTIELSLAAVEFGRPLGIPVFLDIRDLWPDEILTRIPKVVRALGRWALRPLFREAHQALRGATGLVAISDSYLQWALAGARRTRAPSDRVIPLGYTGQLDHAEPGPEVGEKMRALGVDPEKKVYWFSGTFVGNIDLGTVIEAAKALAGDANIQFVFSGAGERDGEWRAKASRLQNVIFTGWAGSEELAWLSRVAWAGLGAYRQGATMSLPNKLFEYMSMGLPVLFCLEGEARQLVLEHGLGAVYEPGDPRSLVELIRRTAGDPEWRAQCSQRATKLFSAHYSIGTLYTAYAEFLEEQGQKTVRMND
jgi:glycosyltransferase involved in cell wall biosynthesis